MSQNKYCPECNHINLNTAKFCSECGHDLSSDSKSLKLQNCEECGQGNNNETRFCRTCGEVLNRQRHTPQKKNKVRKSKSNKQASKKQQPTYSLSKYPLLLIIVGLTLLFIIINNNDKELSTREYSPVQPTSQDFSLERKVIEVASNFSCSCGSCGEEALETCTCGTAEQERNFIRQELQSGKTVSQAIFAVNARFGHLKQEIAGKIEGSGLDLDLSGQKQNDIFSKLSSSASGSDIRIATDQDREEIFSHFECPCGQCGIPELRACICEHPRGATEVKLFVDSKIEDKKHTIGEIVDMVEKGYGHKIR
jgi:cytochrome c-type biogenesis protein CcmH/NrfF